MKKDILSSSHIFINKGDQKITHFMSEEIYNREQDTRF